MDPTVHMGQGHTVSRFDLCGKDGLRGAGQCPCGPISRAQTADAASLSNISRNLGGSIGIAILSTITQTREQVHYQAISDRVSANAQAAAGRIDQLAAVFTARGDDAAMAPMQAVATLAGGQSGNPLSPHYADGLVDWRDGHYRPIVQPPTHKLILTPSG